MKYSGAPQVFQERGEVPEPSLGLLGPNGLIFE